MLKTSKNYLPQKKGLKKFCNKIKSTKEVKDDTLSWHKALEDASVTRENTLQSHKFKNSKTLHLSFHDQKFQLLSRKTQFNNQLSKHTDNSPANGALTN